MELVQRKTEKWWCMHMDIGESEEKYAYLSLQQEQKDLVENPNNHE